MSQTTPSSSRPVSPAGPIFALGAYLIWGFFPIFWKLFSPYSAWIVLAHRILWALPFTAMVLLLWRQGAAVRAAFGSVRQIALLMLSGALIATNWVVFIWGATHGQVLGVSLGYYLTPLAGVVFGLVLFGERLNRLQWTAVALATVGVGNQIHMLGHLPWVSLGTGLSFAAYGAVRKLLRVDSIPGLFVECLLLSPAAVGVLWWGRCHGLGVFGPAAPTMSVLLILGGAVTAIPLLLFVAAAKRLTMTTLGLLFYLTPTMQFFLGWAVYRESLPPRGLLTFALIWIGLAIFSLDRRRVARRQDGTGTPWQGGSGVHAQPETKRN